jgi:hypothetical protein
MREGLNLMQLLIDPTTCRVLFSRSDGSDHFSCALLLYYLLDMETFIGPDLFG